VSETAGPERRTRDRERTRGAILEAARAAFARSGLAGARVDEIAEAAGANKRMLYYYFGSKEELFTAVLETVYEELSSAGASLDLDAMPPLEALDRIVDFVFTFYRDHPDAITLLNSENLHGARHLARSTRIREIEPPFEARLARLIARGEALGAFRSGLDPVRLYVTIAALAYFYLGNGRTLSLFFARDLTRKESLEAWHRHMREVMRRFVEP
jgi:AcrR family transcriptional regulator